MRSRARLPRLRKAVQAMHVETATTATAESNEAGFYNIPNLVPGTYKLFVEKEGFEQFVSRYIGASRHG